MTEILEERLEFRTTPEIQALSLDALARRLHDLDRTRRSRILRARLGASILVIAGVISFVPHSAGAFLVAGPLLGLMEWLGRRLINKVPAEQALDEDVTDVEVRVTRLQLSERTRVRERSWQWAGVRAVHDLGAAILFELAGLDFVTIPSSVWPTEEEKRAFLARLPVQAASGSGLPPQVASAIHGGAAAAALDVVLVAGFVSLILILSGVIPALPLPLYGSLWLLMLLSCALAIATFLIAKHALTCLAAKSPLVAARGALGIAILSILAVVALAASLVFHGPGPQTKAPTDGKRLRSQWASPPLGRATAPVILVPR